MKTTLLHGTALIAVILACSCKKHKKPADVTPEEPTPAPVSAYPDYMKLKPGNY